MPFAANGRIGQDPFEGALEITQEQYDAALEGMLVGKLVTIVDGVLVVAFPPPAPIPDPDPEPEPEPEPTFPELKARKFAELSAMRFVVETGGTTFTGLPIRTDRETCSIITAAYVSAVNDPEFFVSNWKVADGVFIALDAATIIAISTVVRAHVQATFDHEALISVQIVAATTPEALDAIDTTSGW